MPKRVPWKVLLDVVGRFPEGASLEEVMIGLDPVVPRRTTQRWLATLVKNGDLIAMGRARARRYKLPHRIESELFKPITSIPFPLTEGARLLLEKVSQPLQARHPVIYNREFLENYRPNVTYYLPEGLRRKLFEIGSTEDGKYPAGTYARQILHRLLIDLSWNSSRLEGNTYSLLETERLLEWGKAAVGKDLKETQMILNHKAAIEFLINSAEEIGVNRYTILNLHTLLSDNLMPDPAAPGRLRTFSVGISKSTYLPIAIPPVIEECFDLLIAKAHSITDPFEQAFFLMVHIPYLQAFDDVNKRTSRLAANISLIQKNLCPLSFIDVPDQMYINGLLSVYELNRVELLRDVFAWAYERSCILYSTTRKAMGEPDPFRLQYRNALKQIINEIVHHAMDKTQAIGMIRQQASDTIPAEDQARFIETIERELLGLHEGNIARYQLRPKEYEHWKKSWH
ncbi:MAG: Fic family protein [Simkania sp.]|nr:Fic family protein [Simkania sp.]